MARLPSPRRVLFCLLLLAMRVGTASASPDLLATGGWTLLTPHPGDASLETRPAADGELLRFTVANPSSTIWDIQAWRAIPADIPEDHLLRFHFRARSAARCPLRAMIETKSAPYQRVAGEPLFLTPEWQEFNLEGITPGYGPDGINAHLQVGQQAGVIEIAGAALTDLGLDPGIAAARDALRPEQIQARIEKFRQGELTVHVEDAAGRPVPDAVVKVTQTRHAFLFGANFFNLDPADGSPRQQAYQQEFTALFNYATLPFYWSAFESRQGQPSYARLDKMAAWCAAHDLTPKGHPLVWHRTWPSWAPLDAAAIPLLRARVSDIVSHYRDAIHYWDVVNEAADATEDNVSNGQVVWIKRDGAASVVGTALGWARAAGGDAPETFIVNDYEAGAPNVALMAQLRADGKLPDAIGIQSHMHAKEWSMEKVWQVCEAFGQFGRPIHFTETSVLSGPRRAFEPDGPDATDWRTTPEGEARQAEYAVQFYTVLFSHPALRAITYWDFSDWNAWVGAPVGLVRRDMTPKPVYTRLMDLIHRQWWTDASGKTNAAGNDTRRVFYGEYRITVTDATGRTRTQEVSFPEGAAPLAVTVHLP